VGKKNIPRTKENALWETQRKNLKRLGVGTVILRELPRLKKRQKIPRTNQVVGGQWGKGGTNQRARTRRAVFSSVKKGSLKCFRQGGEKRGIYSRNRELDVDVIKKPVIGEHHVEKRKKARKPAIR